MKRPAVAASVIALLLVFAVPAGAHTGFQSSSPADGATVDTPLDEITLTFSGDASPSGEGFVILDSSGNVRQPDLVHSGDNKHWILGFDEPLGDGLVGVRWSVAAPDAHPIQGSFSFNIAAAAVATTSVPITTAGPEAIATAPSTAAPEITIEPDTSPVSTQAEAVESVSDPESSAVDLREFLNPDSNVAAGASRLSAVGRVLSLLGVVGTIGGVTFASFVLRTNADELQLATRWVRLSAGAVVVGATLEGATHVARTSSGWSGLVSPTALAEGLWTWYGLAVTLRIVGGLLLALPTTREDRASTPTDMARVRQLVTVGASVAPVGRASPPSPTDSFSHDEYDEIPVGHQSMSPLAGAALIVMSFAFDGHTVSEGPWALHAVVNAVHVTAASVWAGGVALLAVTLRQRHKRGEDRRSGELALRFSVVATIALVAAGVAGVALSAVILDSVSQLWSTTWGRLLTLKIALVAAAAACGAYNHKVLLPELERNDSGGLAAARLRGIVALEAVVLAGVAVVTAFLIASSAV